MTSTPHPPGKVLSTAIARDMLFQDATKVRLTLPFPERWQPLGKMAKSDLRYQLDLGSVMNFSDPDQEALTALCRKTLEEVGSICKADWGWFLGDHTEYNKSHIPNHPPVPVDQRQFLYINFASRSDAMLVRMTILDLRSVRGVDSRRMPGGAE